MQKYVLFTDDEAAREFEETGLAAMETSEGQHEVKVISKETPIEDILQTAYQYSTYFFITEQEYLTYQNY